MGDASKEVVIRFVGDSTPLVKSSDQAATSFKKVGDSARTAGQQGAEGFKGFLARLQEATDKAALSAIAIKQVGDSLTQAGQNVNQFTGQAAAAFAAFDAARTKVSTLTDDTDGLTNALSGLSDDLKKQASTTELLNSAYDVLSSGFANTADASKVLEAATKGAIGGFSDTNTVADALTSTLNAYNLGADEAANVTDKFIATQNAGKIVVDQYAQQIGKVAPLAAQAGVGLDELNGFIATATIKGVQAEPAFSGIRQAIAAILKPTDDAQKLAKQLGVEFNAAALRTKGLSGILGELNAKGADSAENLTTLFGSVEAVTAIAPATGNNFKLLQQNILASANAAGAADTAFQKVSSSFEGQTKAALNELNDALVSLGKGVTSAVTPIVGALSFLLQNFNRLPEPVKEATGVLIALSGGALTVSGALLGLAALAPVVSAGFGVITSSATAAGGGIGLATAATTAFGTAASRAIPILAAVSAAIAGIQFAKYANDIANVNQSLDELQTEATGSGNSAIALASKLNAINDARAAGRKFSQEDLATQRGLLKLSQDQIKELEAQLQKTKALQPANDEQKAAQANIVKNLELSIGALKSQSSELQKNLTVTKAKTAGDKSAAQASEDAAKAAKKQADTVQKTREADKTKAETTFQDTQQQKQNTFSDQQQQRQQAFADQQQQKQAQYDAEKQKRERQFSDQQEARQRAYDTEKETRQKTFAKSEQQSDREYQKQKQATQDDFNSQQKQAEEAFNKQQRAEEASFKEAQRQRDAQQQKNFTEAERLVARENADAETQAALDRQKKTADAIANLNLTDKILDPQAIVALAKQVTGISQITTDAQRKQVADAVQQIQSAQKDQQAEADRQAEAAFQEQQRQAEAAFKATQQQQEATFQQQLQLQDDAYQQAKEARQTAFNDAERAKDDAFKKSQQAQDDAFKASEQAKDVAFKQQLQQSDRQFQQQQRQDERNFKAEQQQSERNFKAEQRKLDEDSAQRVKNLLANAKSPTAPNIPGRKSGGGVEAGTTYWVGEAGKELFVPSTNGFVLSHGQALRLAAASLTMTPAMLSAPRPAIGGGNTSNPLLKEMQLLRRDIAGMRGDLYKTRPKQNNEFHLHPTREEAVPTLAELHLQVSRNNIRGRKL